MNDALTNAPAWLLDYVGAVVVVDLDEQFLVLGTLRSISAEHLGFTDADLHDHRESNSTKEVYVIESRSLGVRVNRQRLDIPLTRMIAISRLDDVAT